MASADGPALKPRAGVAATSPVVSAAQRRPTASGAFKSRLTVDEQGEFAYKKTPSSTLMASLQLGLQHSIGSLEPKPRRDILMTDFEVVDTVEFPSAGSGSTPAHKYKDFTFKTYSPEAFRYFREAFSILAEDYLIAMCDRPMREISNPGASGSLFYLSADDAFIIKTVQKKEARFLQKLLPGYYLNLTQNKRTLLPKFFGLYRYKCGSVNIRIVVMNNLLPSALHYHEKYDLKGSTYKRRANRHERTKTSPTFKDLDFNERHEEGISLSPEKYDIILKTVERDCKVLESFGIMDYSLLLGVHNCDQAVRDRAEVTGISVSVCTPDGGATRDFPIPSRIELSKNFSIISAEVAPIRPSSTTEEQSHLEPASYPEGGIQGRVHGDRVQIYLGVIDILQSYRLKKKLEHTVKSIYADKNSVSVHNPSFYARRFQDYIASQLFFREKVKFRTRKNSTNVQLRGGRRQTGPGNRGQNTTTTPRQIPGSIPRQLSHDEEPPSYRQVMITDPPSREGRQHQQPQATGADRQRSQSETLSSDHLPEIPSLKPLPSIEAMKQTARRSREIAGEREEEEEGRGEEEEVGGRGEEEGARGRISSEGTSRRPLNDSQERGVREERGGNDFARHVRGTSTPIEDSPVLARAQITSPEDSQTFAEELSQEGGDKTAKEEELEMETIGEKIREEAVFPKPTTTVVVAETGLTSSVVESKEVEEVEEEEGSLPSKPATTGFGLEGSGEGGTADSRPLEHREGGASAGESVVVLDVSANL